MNPPLLILHEQISRLNRREERDQRQYATKRDVLAELSAAAGSMSQETKEEIIRAAYLTLLADKRIAGEERNKLKDIAAALRISQIHLDAIVEGTEPISGEDRS